jgi:phosphopantothenoylcysteine decarboxylase / phosphopantothenate---cysteine ligase
MQSMQKKNVLLGVSGGIGAYKSAELVRELREAGFNTKVVMTEGAQAFITPLTLQTLSGFPVYHSLWNDNENAMCHIELAKWADWIVIAPATAHCIAKLAHGFADDLLTTICLASRAFIALAPAMNQAMWHHPATQDNIQLLKSRNIIFLGPEEGIQACGDIGLGRMQEPKNIVDAIKKQTEDFSTQICLKNQSIVITAGPTREAIDPVRYITNRSSGKMGYALAAAAKEAGAKVTLISGPTFLEPPNAVHCISVNTAEEMLKAVQVQQNKMDIFIGAAAVADYRPEIAYEQKLKKQNYGDTLTLKLIKNPDILDYVAHLDNRPFVVGFAAETENIIEQARDKKIKKHLDMIIANEVNTAESGFDHDNNCGWILTSEQSIELPLMSKMQMAKNILEAVALAKFNKKEKIIL